MSKQAISVTLDADNLVWLRGRAAAALLQLGQAERLWPLLQHDPDPTLRTALVHWLGPAGADPERLLERLQEEPNDAVRQALVLSLGEFSPDRLPGALYRPEGGPAPHIGFVYVNGGSLAMLSAPCAGLA